MPCTDYGRVVVCGPGAFEEHHRSSEGVHWCFRHRGRAEFVRICYRETSPSYYGPWAEITCTACGEVDGDLFPGRVREWE